MAFMTFIGAFILAVFLWNGRHGHADTAFHGESPSSEGHLLLLYGGDLQGPLHGDLQGPLFEFL